MAFTPHCIVTWLHILGILVTGGESDAGDSMTSAEVILSNGRSCTMPSLPSPGKFQHSQTGYVSCGSYWDFWNDDGHDEPSKCYTFTAGQWEQTHTLTRERFFHVSWQSPLGTLLIGGGQTGTGYQPTYAGESTELLSNNDTTTELLFSLPYHTQYDAQTH